MKGRSYEMLIIDDSLNPPVSPIPLFELDVDKDWAKPVPIFGIDVESEWAKAANPTPLEDIKRMQAGAKAKTNVGYETPFMHPDRLLGRLLVERERVMNQEQNVLAMEDAEWLELIRRQQWRMKHRRAMVGTLR